MGSFNSRAPDPGPVTAGELALKAPINAPIFQTTVDVNNSNYAGFRATAYSDSLAVCGTVAVRSAHGSESAPSFSLANSRLGLYQFAGFGSTGFRTTAQFSVSAFSDFTDISCVSTLSLAKCSIASPSTIAVVFTVDQNNLFAFNLPAKLAQYTLATLPNVVTFSGAYITVTNATGGPKLCYSNGANWVLVNTTTPVF